MFTKVTGTFWCQAIYNEFYIKWSFSPQLAEVAAADQRSSQRLSLGHHCF